MTRRQGTNKSGIRRTGPGGDGLRGADRQQADLVDQDSRTPRRLPPTNTDRRSEGMAAQPGAEVKAEPLSQTAALNAPPEGLRRRRRGPLSKTTGRGNERPPAHVPASRQRRD
jgi:hypothetical protein